jgi:type VI secretion system secreted protein Hcp
MGSSIHLKLDGIEGDSQDEGHSGEIEITSVSHGMNMGITGFSSGGSATHTDPQVQEIHITKNTDKASAPLQKALLSATHIATGEINFERPAGGSKVPYLKYQLEEILVTGYSVSSAGDGTPMESITLGFRKHTTVYTATSPSTGEAEGELTAGWDAALNKPV